MLDKLTKKGALNTFSYHYSPFSVTISEFTVAASQPSEPVANKICALHYT
jgi:hypothetical protein